MARRPSEVPPKIVRELNAGTREAANLAESLAMDFKKLAKAAVPGHASAIVSALGDEHAVTKRMRLVGDVLVERASAEEIETLAAHTSDTVRSWAAYAVGLGPGILRQKLKAVRRFADDPHYGVREWAWLAVRDGIVAEPTKAIAALTPWAKAKSGNVRRFASEATRPRGVWCAHIRELRRDPEAGLAILEPLRADTSKYVQDSVANWLNDASKDRSDWVVPVTERWLRESPCEATERIARRARRSLRRGSSKPRARFP